MTLLLPVSLMTLYPMDNLDFFFFFLWGCVGGGAIEMELSKYLRDYSRTVAGKEQLIIAAVAKSLEVIPRQLCDNAGFDSTNILNRLRERHSKGELEQQHPGIIADVFNA